MHESEARVRQPERRGKERECSVARLFVLQVTKAVQRPGNKAKCSVFRSLHSNYQVFERERAAALSLGQAMIASSLHVSPKGSYRLH